MRIVAADAPAERKPNTLYAGKEGGELQMVIRIYMPDQGQDGAGWGPADQPSRARGLPSYEGTLADGTKLDAAGVMKHFALPMNENTKQPLNDQQWIDIVNAKDNDPTLDPATAPARKVPRWEKYWTLPYSILGAFKAPEARSKIPYEGAMDDRAIRLLGAWRMNPRESSVTQRSESPGSPKISGNLSISHLPPDVQARILARAEVAKEANARYWAESKKEDAKRAT